MHIDWFVFFAQIVNFLILVWLLKRFLYGRIITAMDTREAKIASRFEEAEKSKREAARTAEEWEQKNRALKETYEELLNKAREAAEARRKEMMDKAREEVELIRQRWQETILREKDAFIQELRHRAAKQVTAIARRILSDLADVDLEAKIADVFMRNIRKMKDEECVMLRDTLTGSKNGIVIQSAFGIPPETRSKIAETIVGRIGNGLSLQYEKSEDILSGIELRTQGHKIAWSLNDYLESLDESFSHALQEEARPKH